MGFAAVVEYEENPGARAALDVALSLVEIAEERCADVLFVGARGESALVDAPLRSACHRLVHFTTVPLVLVPPVPGTVQT